MATRARRNTGSEFEGTSGDDLPIEGASIDPASLVGDAPGSGGDSGGSSGTDDFVRDGSGNIKRNKDGSPRRKRGRKAGSSNGGGSGQAKGDLKGAVDTLSRTLLMLHIGIAGVTKTPEFVLDEEESKMLANATVNVLSEFDIRPNPKAEAIFGLIVAAGTVYGPRFYMIRKRTGDEARNKAPNGADDYTVVPGPGFAVHTH